MPLNYTVRITWDDIKKGSEGYTSRGSFTHDPFARALARATNKPVGFWFVGRDFVWYGNNYELGQVSDLPPEAKEWIRRHENGKDVAPAEFVVNLEKSEPRDLLGDRCQKDWRWQCIVRELPESIAPGMPMDRTTDAEWAARRMMG